MTGSSWLISDILRSQKPLAQLLNRPSPTARNGLWRSGPYLLRVTDLKKSQFAAPTSLPGDSQGLSEEGKHGHMPLRNLSHGTPGPSEGPTSSCCRGWQLPWLKIVKQMPTCKQRSLITDSFYGLHPLLGLKSDKFIRPRSTICEGKKGVIQTLTPFVTMDKPNNGQSLNFLIWQKMADVHHKVCNVKLLHKEGAWQL